MATQETQNTNSNNKSLLSGLSMIGGLGITMMVLAAAVGVVNPEADSNIVRLIVLGGLGLLIMSVAGWFITVQPHKNFDDINKPLYHGHHHDASHDEGEEHTH